MAVGNWNRGITNQNTMPLFCPNCLQWSKARPIGCFKFWVEWGKMRKKNFDHSVTYGMFVFPPWSICWNSNPQYDGSCRWDFWGVIRSKGWSPRDQVSALIGRGSRTCFSLCSPPRDDTLRRWLSISRKRNLTRPQPHWHSDFGLSAFRTMRNVCRLSHPVYGMLLQQPKLRPIHFSWRTQMRLLSSFWALHIRVWPGFFPSDFISHIYFSNKLIFLLKLVQGFSVVCFSSFYCFV